MLKHNGKGTIFGIFASINNQEMEKNMKKLQMFMVSIGLLLCTIITGCATIQTEVAPDIHATDVPESGIPNPASVYCEEQGNTLEIQTAADGSQSGVCIFPDGSTCDEWAYFRGECGVTVKATEDASTDASGGGPGGGDNSGGNASGGFMQPGTSELFSDWWGVIKSTDSGAQYDDYFERQDLGLEYINFGIDSMDPDVQAQIITLRDSGKIVHLYGTLFSNVPDYNGSQVLVDRIVVED
jgi:putative hemolysin